MTITNEARMKRYCLRAANPQDSATGASVEDWLFYSSDGGYSEVREGACLRELNENFISAVT